MRSRYSAYALGLEDYVQSTWHVSTRPRMSDAGRAREPAVTWLGLSVKGHAEDGDRATVEFVARYRARGRGHRLHEVSRFVREDGRWFYIDGTIGSGDTAR